VRQVKVGEMGLIIIFLVVASRSDLLGVIK